MALAIGAVCLGLLPASRPAQAQISSSEEYRLKLAFLYNFAKFVEWPADAFSSPQAPLNICIVGRDPFDSELEQQIGERTINGHPYLTRRLLAGDDLGACHVVFLPAGSDGALPVILKRLRSSGALIVGESAG
ncbi:MAG TPA: YfiR family protein, partial [Terriglobales bacterium]|nr:YfiR family protein [Terriglobales bacterium]